MLPINADRPHVPSNDPTNVLPKVPNQGYKQLGVNRELLITHGR